MRELARVWRSLELSLPTPYGILQGEMRENLRDCETPFLCDCGHRIPYLLGHKPNRCSLHMRPVIL